MNGKRTFVLMAFMLVATAILAAAVDLDADQTFSSETSYSDGFVTVQGTVPDAYANEQSHIDIEVLTSEGVLLASGFAEPTSEGVYKQLVKVALSNGEYSVRVALYGTGQKTVELKKDLTVSESAVISVESISLSPSSKELTVGGSVTLVCTINPVTATDKNIVWTSSDSSVATVDGDGKVVAISAGTATIKAVSSGGKEATSTITVKPSSSENPSGGSTMSITASSDSVYRGDSTVTLTATYPSNIGADSLRWSISPSNYASFTESSTVGKSTVHLQGKVVGNVTVTLSSVATSETATVRISVMERPNADATEYSFYLRMDLDYDRANYGSSGLSAQDLKDGIILTGTGPNAGAALEKALKANKIPCSFYSGGQLKYWVNNIFGLGDYQYSNGDWKYWIQYHNGSYNDWTLGYYTEGGSFELIYGITKENGQVVRPESHSNDNSSSSTNTNPDGSKTTEVVNEDGSKTETTTSADGKTTSVVETDADGNKTTTEIVKGNDGSVSTTTTRPDGSKETNKADAPVVTEIEGGTKTEISSSTEKTDAEGNVVGLVDVVDTVIKMADGSEETIKLETEKDAEGNVKGSTEKSETKDFDGNITEKSEVLRDKDGNETYSKVEEIVPTKVTEEEGKTVTESSTKVTEKESGKTTVTEESVKETVGADGAKETEKVREESVTDSNGSTSSKKVTEKVVEDGESKLTSTQTESKDASGKETSEKKVEAESKDGSVKSSVEVPQDGGPAEIVTVLGSDQSGGVMSISSEQVKLAVSLQEKVSGEISDVQQEKVMLAESTTDSMSLTLSGEAMKSVSDSGASLNIVSSEGALKVSKEVLENLSGEDEVVIQFSASEDISLSEDQKDAIGENASVLEIKVMSDGESLGSSINGTLTLLVKHVAAEGMVPAMYYVADNGDMEKLEGSYDAERQEMTGITTHCSIYAVIDEDPNAGDDNALLYAGVAIITILAVVAVAGFLYMRRS